VLGLLPSPLRRRLYRLALDRGLDELLLTRFLVRPLWGALRAAAAAERRWVAFLGGAAAGTGRPGDDGGVA
jgi:hypothetical protein